MGWAVLFYVVGALAFVSLFVLNGIIAHTVLPPRLRSGVQGRRWTLRELAIVLAPGVLAAILGLVFLGSFFWTVVCSLSLVMLASAMTIWGLGRRWPHLYLSQKTARLFLLYLVVALVATIPVIAGSGIRWTHLRGLLALVVLLLFVAVASAGALLVIGGATVYFAVACEIVRSLLLPPAAIEEEPAEAPTEPGSLPAQSDFEGPGARSA